MNDARLWRPVSIAMRPDFAEYVMEVAASQKMSRSRFVVEAVKEKLARIAQQTKGAAAPAADDEEP